MTFLKKYWHYLFIIVNIVIWMIFFPINYIYSSNLFLFILYFISSFIAYIYIRKLEINILCIGAILVFYGFLLNIFSVISFARSFMFFHIISITGIIVLSYGVFVVINKISYFSFRDYLTDLYNRRYFENELERLNSSRISPISIIIADLDNLKRTNDLFGHLQGDRYLKKTARVLKSVLREEDIIARIGGDEFVIILPETTHDKAQEIIKRIYNNLEALNNSDQLPEPLTIALGAATINSGSEDAEACYSRADKKMYEHKNKFRS